MTGRFRIGPLPAGTYRLHGGALGFLPHEYLATAIVADAEERDLGPVALKPAGKLVVVLRRADGGSTREVKVFLALESEQELTTRIGDRVESGAIAPGRYRVYVADRTPIDRAHPREVDVRAGETTKLEVELGALPR